MGFVILNSNPPPVAAALAVDPVASAPVPDLSDSVPPVAPNLFFVTNGTIINDEKHCTAPNYVRFDFET